METLKLITNVYEGHDKHKSLYVIIIYNPVNILSYKHEIRLYSVSLYVVYS